MDLELDSYDVSVLPDKPLVEMERLGSKISEKKPQPFGPGKFWIDFKYLFLEQVLQLRAIWPFTLLIAFVMPLALVYGFSRVGRGVSDSESLIYVISGSAVFAVATEGLYTTSQRISTMKAAGRLLYYAALPISKTAFVMALLFSRLLMVGLPSMLIPVVVGPVIYNVPIASFGLLWIILLLPLTAFSLSGLGMFIGLAIPNTELVGMLANLSLLIVLLVCPVFIPFGSLFLPFQVLSLLLPPTYAADAVRHALAGTIDLAFFLDLMVLLAFAVVSFVGISKFLRWRID